MFPGAGGDDDASGPHSSAVGDDKCLVVVDDVNPLDVGVGPDLGTASFRAANRCAYREGRVHGACLGMEEDRAVEADARPALTGRCGR